MKRVSSSTKRPVSRIVEEALNKYFSGQINFEKIIERDINKFKASVEKFEVMLLQQRTRIDANKVRPLKDVILEVLRDKTIVSLRELEESVYKVIPVKLKHFHRKLRELVDEGVVKELKVGGETLYTLSPEVKKIRVYGQPH